MSRRRVAGGVALCLAVSALAACSLFDDDKEPEPVTTRIPNEPPADAELVCGMDRASVETAVGYQVGRVEGSLDAVEGCLVWPVEGTFPGDWVLAASVIDAESDEAVTSRGAIEGTAAADGKRPPDVRYDDVLGGAWRFELGTTEATRRAGASSVVFAGDRVVALTSVVNAEGRDAPTDLRALSLQVTVSQGLAPDPGPGRD